MSQTYRVWYFPKRTSYTDLELTQLSLYEASKLKDDEVLVKIRAVSFQHRDLEISEDRFAAKVIDNLIPCSDCSGKVVAVGAGITEWKKGDRVCANFSLEHFDGPPTPETLNTSQGGPAQGVLREWKVFSGRSLVKIPDHLTFEQASTLPCATLTAYSALMGLVPLKGGDTVLVMGSGGVSIAALQIAVASGAKVIATSSSDEKAAFMKKLGASHVVNYKTDSNWDEEVLKLTSGHGVDHTIEVGGSDTLVKSMNATKWNGIIHTIGFVSGGDASVPQLLTKIIFKAQIIRGNLIGSVAQFRNLNRLIEATKIVPVVDRVFSFEEVKEAYAYLKSQKHIGNVVIRVA